MIIKVVKIEDESVKLMSFYQEQEMFQLWMVEVSLGYYLLNGHPDLEKQEGCMISLDTLISFLQNDEDISNIIIKHNDRRIDLGELIVLSETMAH